MSHMLLPFLRLSYVLGVSLLEIWILSLQLWPCFSFCVILVSTYPASFSIY